MSQNKNGFTIVEILIVMPIVILVIGVFITTAVSMTGDVLASRGANALIYDIHNALAQIELDVKLSSGYLETNNFTLSAPQGSDDTGTTAFLNISGSGTALILNSVATTANPLNTSRNIVYKTGSPNPCDAGQTQIDQNDPVQVNIVYFVKNGTLWRRTIMPSGYTTVGYGCNALTRSNATIWQQASCAPTASGGICATKDMKLVSGITNESGFRIDYYTLPESATPDIIANDISKSNAERHAALQTISTINATIDSNVTVAGRDINQSGNVRVSLSK